jgi:hypothetical protein
MGICVIAHSMSFLCNSIHDARVFLNILAHAEEGSGHAVLIKYIQHLPGDDRMGPVIKCQVNRWLSIDLSWARPHQLRGHRFHNRRGFTQIHATKIFGEVILCPYSSSTFEEYN